MADRVDMFTDEDGVQRHGHGTRIRACSGGDGWAELHRLMDRTFLMNDFDVFFGTVAFAKNASDKLFAEYVPDPYENRNKAVRNFALLALFDRKATESAVQLCSTVSLAFYLYVCRVCAAHQPIPPRFFYVIGSDVPPWKMLEVDIRTGSILHDEAASIGSLDEMQAVWRKLRFPEMRRSLSDRLRYELEIQRAFR